VKNRGSSRPIFVWIVATVLWWGVASLPARSAAEGRTLKVVSSATGLAVEAHGVGAEEVLREIGEQVGFTVVIKGAARPLLNVSLKDATLEEALQEILRGENYAILYPGPKGEGTQARGRIGKILLLSPSNTTEAAPNVAPLQQEQERRQAVLPRQETAPSPAEAPPADQATAAVFSKDGWKLLTGKDGERRWPGLPALSDGSHHPEWFHKVAERFLAAVAGDTRAEANLAEAALCCEIEHLARESSRRGGVQLPLSAAPVSRSRLRESRR